MRNFKRVSLVAAVAAALGTGPVLAAVDLDAGEPAKYGSEIKLDDTASGFANTSGELDIVNKVGTPPLDALPSHLRYEMINGEFPDVGEITFGMTCTGGSDAEFATPYNPNGDKSVIIVTATGPDCALDDKVVMTLPDPAYNGTHGGQFQSQDGAQISYGRYSNVNDAIANTNNLYKSVQNVPYVTFEESFFEHSVQKPNVSVIDVQTGNKKFEEGVVDTDTAAVCGIELKERAGVRLPSGEDASTTAPANEFDVVDGTLADTTLEIEGDFTAVDGAGDIYLATADDCATAASIGTSGGNTASDLSADGTTATFELGNWEPETVYVCMDVNGSDVIQPAKYEATYKPKAAAGYEVEDIAFGECGEVRRGGSSASVTMTMHPSLGGIFRALIRITNPSNIDGDVHITAYNDNGVEGNNTYSFFLPAGASTGMIDVPTIVTATGVPVATGTGTDAGTAGGKINKIRLVVNAEFGSNDGDDGVIVRTYTPSTDLTTFTEFQ